MLFNSFEFLVFYPLVVTAYFLLPGRYRWALLLAASYYFYGSWDVGFLFLLIASTVIDYFVGIHLGRTEDPGTRKRFLIASLGVNLGILCTFKYFNFFRENISEVARWFGSDITFQSTGWVLPVGISFYTFQSIGYTIDVYRKRMEPIKHFGMFALYVAYFPQLVAGPIERAGQLIPQFEKFHVFNSERASKGLALMLWGLFKKVAVADRLAIIVDEVYRQPDLASAPDLVIATLAFYLQIYCDFSGYTDIAIGCASLMGVELMDNFNRPYLAVSITDFWSRWHISLSTWFRDYLYIPLGGNRKGPRRWMFNVLVVFLLSGFWHGAAWTFIVWGLLHSVYYFVERFIGPRCRTPRLLDGLITFTAVSFAWIFFRAQSIAQALLIVSKIFTQWSWESHLVGQLPTRFLAINAVLLALMFWLDSQQGDKTPRGRFQGPTAKRWTIYYLLLFCIILYGNYESHAFIYFQF